MIEPAKIFTAAQESMPENLAFLHFLLQTADPETLDLQFHALHTLLFADYDCCLCSHCCKPYTLLLHEGEAARISAYLGLTQSVFADRYLVRFTSGSYGIEGPCPFLQADGKCQINICKPAVCKAYPNTDTPGRWADLQHIIAITEECPVVYEIIEKLKEIYRFPSKGESQS